MARLPHVVFACLFAGLALFAVTGNVLVRDVVQLIAVTLLAVQAVRHPDARLAWTLLTVANVAWAVGDLDPTRLNALFLVSFAFAQLGLVSLAATQLRDRWLAFDGVMVGLTAAAILTAYVSDSLVGLGLRVPATALAGDAMLVTTIVLAFAVNGWRPARAWWVIALGEAFLVVNDLTLTSPLAPPRSALVAWAAALLLTSYAAFFSAAPRTRQVGGAIAAAVPIAGGAVCVGLLIHAALTQGNPVTVWLAGAALLVGLIRAAFLLRENHQLVRSARAEAVTDKLTGLPNRRALIEDLDRAVASKAPHTLAFFDLDGFKEYNDAFGHAAGDALLQRLAPRLAAVGRAYRLGGDEFCLLTGRALADGSPETVAAVAALAEHGDGFTISASHGLVTLPDEVQTAADALRRADERMYARKRRRRAGQAGPARDVLVQVLAERGADDGGVPRLAVAIGRRLGLDGEELDVLARAAELRHIGLLAVPDAILAADAPETHELFRRHPLAAERILTVAESMRPVARLVRAAHERYDGTGFPDGLRGEEIPLGARIIAAAVDPRGGAALDPRVLAALIEGDITASHGLVALPDEAGTAADALQLADERKRGRRAGQADILLRMLAEHGIDEDRAEAFASAFSAASSAAAAPGPAACGPAGCGRTSAPVG